MTLATCRRGLHPLRRFVVRAGTPAGPQGATTAYVHAECRFCAHSDRLFALSVSTEGEGRQRRTPPTRRDMRAALADFRRASRKQPRTTQGAIQ